ncbi:ZMYM5 protein, partial [Polyodon spathula]|nr:ZMYM5 protein [Polyodon spathula]
QVKELNFLTDNNSRRLTTNHHTRVLANRKKIGRPWLVYSTSKNAAFCFCCKMFLSNAKFALASNGTQDWKNLSLILSKRKKAPDHLKSFQKWKELETRLNTNTAIDDENQRIIKAETQHWQNVLERLIAIIQDHFVEFLELKDSSGAGMTEPCSSHSLNLVLNDAANCCSEAVEFFSLIQNIFHKNSIAHKRSLEILDVRCVLQSDHSWADITDHIAKSMRRKLSKKGSIFIRMKAVFPNSDEASSMFFHLVQVADSTANTILDIFLRAFRFKTRATCKGLKDCLTDTSFVLNMGLLFDVLVKLEELSLELQKQSTTLMHAHKLVKQKCLVFQSMWQNPREHFLNSQQAVCDAEFKEVALQKGRMTAIDYTRFSSCLLIKMEQRMLTTHSSHRALVALRWGRLPVCVEQQLKANSCSRRQVGVSTERQYKTMAIAVIGAAARPAVFTAPFDL